MPYERVPFVLSSFMLGVIKYVGESSSALLAVEDFAVSSGDAVVPTVPVGTLARASSFEQPLKIEAIIKIITNRITNALTTIIILFLVLLLFLLFTGLLTGRCDDGLAA